MYIINMLPKPFSGFVVTLVVMPVRAVSGS